MNDFFFNWRPAFPWSISPIGLPALALVAILLVVFTIWTYLGHPNTTRRRITIVLALRLAALVIALLTAVRPSVGVQEDPKLPSVLLIGVDLSESMTTRDEINNQSRIDAVRKTLEKCQPILDELATEQNVSTVIYRFSTADFNEATSRFAPGDPANGKRSDYGTYLNKTFERWQGERYMRGHLLVGDGAHNGETFSPFAEAGRWSRRGTPLTTFTVGSESVTSDAQDIVVSGVECDPSPAYIKNDLTVIGSVHAFGFAGTRVVARVSFNGKVESIKEVVLEKENDNKVRIELKAPAEKGEYKVKFEVGQMKDGELVPLKGEHSAENNYSETYLTVNKEGVRILIVDRLRDELTRIRDALRSEKRFDLNEVHFQPGAQPTASQREFLDLDAQAYDVVIIGNVAADELMQIDRDILRKINDGVMKRGMGLMFLGGEHSFRGMPGDILPVIVAPGVIVEEVDRQQRPLKFFQTIPTENGLSKMMKMSSEPKQSVEIWNELNASRSRPLLTGYNKMSLKPTSTLYAWTTSSSSPINAGTPMPDRKTDPNVDPLLAGHQIGDGSRGRVLALAAFNTFLWEKLGQPKRQQGTIIHTRFWRQCALWLAHQDEEEGQAELRVLHRQLKVGSEQVLRPRVKLPNGTVDPNAEMTVKIVPLPEGKLEPDPAEIERAKPEPIVRDQDGAKVLFRPRLKGEYFGVLTSPKKDADGKPVFETDGRPSLLRATAKFIAIPDTSDEMLRLNAEHDFMVRLSVSNGGKALRLEELPGYLKELKSEPLSSAKPKPRYYPDWRRNHSKGFLPLWFVLFVALLGTEWGLRRLWGMV